MEQIFFHIDVNSAFLSWSAIRLLKEGYPDDIRLIPSIIGGDIEQRHGIVLAKSIPAKAYQITTGEPIVHAWKKCPSLLSFPPDHAYYQLCSQEMMEYLSGYTDQLEQLSIDECFLNFTGIRHRYASPEEGACHIKDGIYQRFGFTVNIGISTNKLLAKMSSDSQKPNRIHTLYPHEIPLKMWPLPISELYMAGKASVKTLHNLGITTIGELAATPPELLHLHLKSHGTLLWEYANGIDNSPFTPKPGESKGIGNSTTLASDVSTLEDASRVLLDLSETVAFRLRKSGFTASMVSVEIKYSNFTKTSRQIQVSPSVSSAMQLYHIAVSLFIELWNHMPIRLLGIRASKLTDENTPVQLSLFPEEMLQANKFAQADAMMDSIRDKFGKNSMTRASFLKQTQAAEKKDN